MCIRARKNSGRVSPDLGDQCVANRFLRLARGLQPPNEISWRGEIETAHADFSAWTDKATAVPGGVNLGEIMVWLRDNLPTDSFITNGAGNFATWINRFYRFRKYATLVGPTSGSMGYGLPAAIAMRHCIPTAQLYASPVTATS